MTELTEVQKLIKETCDELADFLIEKNRSYGSSFSDPLRIFSRASTDEQINVRIDDKLSRILRGGSYPGDNDEWDLTGYLVLKRVNKKLDEENDYQKPGIVPECDGTDLSQCSCGECMVWGFHESGHVEDENAPVESPMLWKRWKSNLWADDFYAVGDDAPIKIQYDPPKGKPDHSELDEDSLHSIHDAVQLGYN